MLLAVMGPRLFVVWPYLVTQHYSSGLYRLYYK